MLKARINNLEVYLNHIKENTEEFCKSFHDVFHGMWNIEEVKRLDKAHDVLFSYWPGKGYAVSEKTVEKITYINQYIVQNQFYWEVLVQKDGYAVYTMGQSNFSLQKNIWTIKKKKTIPLLQCLH